MSEESGFKQTDIGMVPKDWDIKVLLDVLLEKPRNGLYKPRNFHGKGTKMVNMGELFAYDKIGDSDMELVELTDSEKERFLLKNGDLVFARRSLIASGAGKCSLIVGSIERSFESSIIRARPNPSKANSEFLYYFFSSSVGKHLLGSILRQVAVAGVTGSDLMNLKIPLPPLKEQNRIAETLAVLDEKIALNQATNETLEAVGKALFNRWFVDFEFPNEDGKPYKSSGGEMAFNSGWGIIPSQWQTGKLNQITDLMMGISPEGASYNDAGIGMPLLNGAADFQESVIVPRKWTTNPIKICKRGSLLFCIRATIGNLVFADKEYCLGRGVAALTPKTIALTEFIYYILQQSLKELTSKASGSVILGLSKSDIEELPVLFPDSQTLDSFHEICSVLFSKIANQSQNSRTLASIRDCLLPKLMSGKIRFPVRAETMEVK